MSALVGNGNLCNPTISAPLYCTSSATPIACFGDSTGVINLDVSGGTPPFTFNWGNGVTTQNRSGLATGIYAVTVTDATGVTTVQTDTLSQPSAALSVNLVVSNATGSIGGTILAISNGGTPPYQYEWSNGATVGSLTDVSPGIYSLHFTDANECAISVAATIDIELLAEETLEKLNFWVFPNPASGHIIVHSATILPVDLSMMLISSKGEVVRQTSFNRGMTQYTLETKTLADGHYFLTISDGKSFKVIRVAVSGE
jgi:hypothetical protein